MNIPVIYKPRPPEPWTTIDYYSGCKMSDIVHPYSPTFRHLTTSARFDRKFFLDALQGRVK